MAWTSPRTWVALEVPTAATFNTHVRDNLREALRMEQVSYNSSGTIRNTGTVINTMGSVSGAAGDRLYILWECKGGDTTTGAGAVGYNTEVRIYWRGTDLGFVTRGVQMDASDTEFGSLHLHAWVRITEDITAGTGTLEAKISASTTGIGAVYGPASMVLFRAGVS